MPEKPPTRRDMSETIEKGERCNCDGEIDCLYLIDYPDIWAGRCFQCGRKFIVIQFN